MGYVIEYPGNSWKTPKKGRLWIPVCAVLCALALVGLIRKDSRYFLGTPPWLWQSWSVWQ